MKLEKQSNREGKLHGGALIPRKALYGMPLRPAPASGH